MHPRRWRTRVPRLGDRGLVAGFDRRDPGGRGGSTEALEVYSTTSEQGVDAAFEVAGGQMCVEVGAGARRLSEIPMAGQRIALDAEVLGGPGECQRGSVKLCLRDCLLVEVSFAEQQEVSGGVVIGRGVAGKPRVPQFVEVAVAVDGDVVRDVNPSLLILVIQLILAQAFRRIAVVAEHDCLVVQGHSGDGVPLAAGAGGARAPRLSAQQRSRGGAGQTGADGWPRGARAPGYCRCQCGAAGYLQ